MKKIFNFFMASILLVALASCSEDTDSNPVLLTPDTFTLNVPAAAINNTYDLEHSKALNLTCSQPEYGFPAATVYSVELTLSDEFIEETDNTEKNYITLSTTYNTANMNVEANEINNAIIQLLKKENSSDLNKVVKVTLRLKANIYQSELGGSTSNTIVLPKVLCFEPTATVSLPTELFLIGSMSNSQWSTWVPMNPVFGVKGEFYSVTYFAENSNFKVGLEKDNWGTALSYDKLTSINENAITLAGIEDNVDDYHNIKITKAGWYTVVITTEIANDKVSYNLNIANAEVYLIGAVNGGNWNWSTEGAFTSPKDDTEEWISPAFTGSGEVRMSIKVPNEDWWRTEFTLKDGTDIFYRNTDIVSDWASNVGAEYSIDGVVGNKIHLDFLSGKGSVK